MADNNINESRNERINNVIAFDRISVLCKPTGISSLTTSVSVSFGLFAQEARVEIDIASLSLVEAQIDIASASWEEKKTPLHGCQ